MYRSTVLVFLCLVGVAFSFTSPNFLQRNVQTRENANSCTKYPDYTCHATGAACAPQSDCISCGIAYETCSSKDSNKTNCECLSEYTNCVAAVKNVLYCNSTEIFEQCMNNVANCSCGTPYTGISLFCPDFTQCSNTTRKCTVLAGLGGACAEDSDCSSIDSTRGLQCRDNVCHYPEYSGSAGEPCQEDEECVGYKFDESTCENGKCTAVQIGGNCTVTDVCVLGAFCNSTSGLCQTAGVFGDACSVTDSSCSLPYVCSKVNNTCVMYMSQPSGAACYDSIECNLGLMCKDGVCASQVFARNCTSDSTCSAANGYDGSCECDRSLGYTQCTPSDYGYPTSCQDSFKNVANCFQKAGCTRPSGCQDCSVEQLCLDQCLVDAYKIDKDPSACNYIPFTCGTTTTGDNGSTTGSGSSVITASIATIFAAVLIVV